MPIPQETLKRLDEAIDRCLTKRDRDTDPKQFQESLSARNPLDAPPRAPFYRDGAPQRIHGEPSKKDLFH